LPPLVKLLDFGVSKMIVQPFEDKKDDETDLTRTGMVMGTPYYMAPEQASGDRNLDARVDLYACGVMLYEALTGRRPFTAANYNALLLQILSTNPRPARDLRPALPGGFDAVLDKAMARSRDDRYRTATEFQGDLQALHDRPNRTPAGFGDALREARFGPPVRGHAEPPPPRARPFAFRATPAPTPSSVEIPIVFSGESGETVAFDASQVEEHPLRDTAPTGKPTVRDTDVTGRPAVDVILDEREARGAAYASQPRAPGSSRRKTLRTRPVPPVPPDEPMGDLPDDPDGGEPTQLMPSRVPKAPRG
jgi:serine/threonine-protein kinase